jgi:DNA-binding NarL/FixJ family response regulator
MKNIRVMLVEDNREYRESISLILKHAPGLELINEFATSEVALRSLQTNSSVHPDLVLLDLRLPGMDGLESLPYFRCYAPHAKVIILTQSYSEKDVLRAIKLGASGYLLKTASAEEIIEGIRTVMDGGASLDPGVANFILKSLKVRLPEKQPENTLSERELEVLTLLAKGLVKKEIAGKLDIQYSTVDYHVGRLYEKLDVRNAPAAVDRGHKLGLFKPDEENAS